MKKKVGKFYDIMTQEDSNEATVFLYGYIGEEYSIGANGWELSGNTDTDFIKELDRLSAQYARINVRINSYGGEIYHGMPIISAMQRCKAEVHTYIDGLAASMAGVIWLCGKHRHMAKNAMLMLHAGSNICWGNAKDMREVAGVLDQFTKTMAIAIAESTAQSVDDIQKKYFSDYADHWLTHDEVAAESGWITDSEEYSAENEMPKAISTMKYHDLVAYFKEKDAPKERESIMQQVKSLFSDFTAAFTPPKAAIQSQPNTHDMTIEEFKASLKDGTLALDDVKEHLSSIATAATPQPEEDEDEAAIKELKAMVATLTQKVEAFAAAPGAGKANPGFPEADHATADGSPTAQQRYDKANKEMAAAAETGETAKFVIQ